MSTRRGVDPPGPRSWLVALAVAAGCATGQTAGPGAPAANADFERAGVCEGMSGGRCRGRPPAASHAHSGERPDCNEPGSACTRQIDPGPYQIWQNVGPAWHMVGVLNVTGQGNTRYERWAFNTGGAHGYHHPNGSTYTQVYLWFGRLDPADPNFAPSYPTPNTDTDVAFQAWARGALAKLHGFYPDASDVPGALELFRSTVVCQDGAQCNLGLNVLTLPDASTPAPR